MGQSALKSNYQLSEIQNFDRNLANQVVITDSDKISSLISTLNSELTQAQQRDEKDIIKAQIATLKRIRAEQIALTETVFLGTLQGVDSNKAIVLGEDFGKRKENHISDPKITQSKIEFFPDKEKEIKEATNNIIDGKEKFQQAVKEAETTKTIEDTFVIKLNKKQELALKMAKESVIKDSQVFKGYTRQVIVSTPLQGTLPPKINELISKADTESKVDEIAKVLINNGQPEQALNISLDLFTTPLGVERIRNHKRSEIELRFINETIPWAYECPVTAMKDPNDFNLGEWLDYVEDIAELYLKKDKIIADAVSDLKKQKFIAKEAGKPLEKLMFEEIIYEEIMGAIALGSNIKLDDIKFESLDSHITEAEIIEVNDDTDHPVSTTENEKKIVEEAEIKATETKDPKILVEETKKGFIEIIMKGMKDKSINIYNACNSFWKNNPAKHLFDKSFKLNEFIKDTKEQLQPIIDKEKEEEIKTEEQKVEQLADTNIIENKEIISDHPKFVSSNMEELAKKEKNKKPNLQNVYKQMSDEELNKLDPSMLETAKKYTDLSGLAAFTQQVIFDMPRTEAPKFEQKDAYHVGANLFFKSAINIPELKNLTEEQLKETYFHDVMVEGRKTRPELTNKDLKNLNTKKEVIEDLKKKDVNVTFDNTENKALIALPKIIDNTNKDLEESVEKTIEAKTDANISDIVTETVTSPSSEIKWKNLPEDIKKEFAPILSTSSKIEFRNLSEKFLLKNDFKTFDERNSILANVIWPETAQRKKARPNERENGVKNIIKNSPKIENLLKSSSAVNAIVSALM